MKFLSVLFVFFHPFVMAEDSIHIAAERGDLSVLEYLLDAYPSTVNMRDENGRTALHYASYNGHLDAVKLLVSEGANINARGKHGGTPVYLAGYKGYLDIIKFLFSKGAKLNTKTTSGNSVWDTAQALGHLPILLFLYSIYHQDLHSNS